MDKYVTLDVFHGDIDAAVKVLQEWNDKYKNKKATINFNGHWLHSDTVTIDSAYLEITGKTKEEFNNEREEWKQTERLRKVRYETKIPELTKEWIKKGHNILNEKYWDKWDECVPARLSDLYEGMELGACLDIVEQLNSGCTLSYAKQIINNQYHSGMSYAFVRAMVKAFCDRGSDFDEYLEREDD